MLIYEKNVHRKKNLSQSGAEKITFSPKPDRQTDRHTDGRTFAFIELNYIHTSYLILIHMIKLIEHLTSIELLHI